MAKDWTEENLDAQESVVMDIVERLRWRIHTSEDETALINEAAEEIERLRKGFVWLDDTIEGHLLLNPEKNSNLIQEIKRKISFILSNGSE